MSTGTTFTLSKMARGKIYKIEETEPIFKPGNIDNKDVEDAKKHL